MDQITFPLPAPTLDINIFPISNSMSDKGDASHSVLRPRSI